MGKNLFVGGLPYETTQDELKRVFSGFGTVTSAKVILDRETGRSKGFAFVEMSTEDEAKAAIAGLNGKALGARTIFVNEARPPEKRVPGAAPRPGGFTPRRDGPPGGGAPAAPKWDSKPSWDKKPSWDDSRGGGKKKWDDRKKWDEPGRGKGGDSPKKKGGRPDKGDFGDDDGWGD